MITKMTFKNKIALWLALIFLFLFFNLSSVNAACNGNRSSTTGLCDYFNCGGDFFCNGENGPINVGICSGPFSRGVLDRCTFNCGLIDRPGGLCSSSCASTSPVCVGSEPASGDCDINCTYIPPKSLVCYRYGDVDGDGKIEGGDDAGGILRYVAQLKSLTSLQIEHADVFPYLSETGANPGVSSVASDVNSVDALMVLRYLVGLETTFTPCGTLSASFICSTGKKADLTWTNLPSIESYSYAINYKKSSDSSWSLDSSTTSTTIRTSNVLLPNTAYDFNISVNGIGWVNLKNQNSGAACQVCGNGIKEGTEQCDGGACCSGSCSFLGSGNQCRGSVGVCDPAEYCSGSSNLCPNDVYNPAGTSCRGSAGVCDVAETCSGSSASCPADVKQPSTTICRDSVGICDVTDYCNGVNVNCLGDVVTPAGTPCRASTGICDSAESCSGFSNSCPANLYSPAGTVCRASVNPVCDPAETCSGSGASCPADSNSCGVCGDGTVNPGEACDTGASRDSCPASCSLSCTLNSCPPCSGAVSLAINPEVTTANAPISYAVSGLLNCAGTVQLHYDSCSGPNVGSCSITSGIGCAGSFTAPAVETYRRVVACADINGNALYGDILSENDSKFLTVNICVGDLAFFWNPSSIATIGTEVQPVAGNMVNCSGKTAYFDNEIYCPSPVDSCTLDSWGCGGTKFNAPSPAAVYPYYVCVNKNAAVNSNFVDAGENANNNLVTTPVPCIPTPNCDFLCGWPSGSDCQCGAECSSNYCGPITKTCLQCTSDDDCVSPPDVCSNEVGSCVLVGGAKTCVYTKKNPLPCGCTGCTVGTDCISGTCTAGVCSSCSPIGSSSCNSLNPLDNCGAESCPMCIVGYVESYTGAKLQSAIVNYQPGQFDAKSFLTSVTGWYAFFELDNLTLLKTLQTIPPAGSELNPSTIQRTLHQGINLINLILGKGSSDCTSDCTRLGQPFCAAECDGTNGCDFVNDEIKLKCDGVTKSFRRDLSGATEVVCCTGSPSPKYGIQSIASVPQASNVFTITRAVFFAGRLVKMKIVVFR